VRVVYSDASNTGYGGYTVEHGGQIVSGQWDQEESLQSSTWRELRAVRMVLMSFESKLHNERVCWFTDNQNVVRIVLHGSKKLILQHSLLHRLVTQESGHRLSVGLVWMTKGMLSV